MAVKTQPVRNAVATLGHEIQAKTWTLGRDRRTERKKRLLWIGLSTALGAAATFAARKLASKSWRILTGEEPPAKR
jgi:uncharacterized protein DUF4235